MSQTEYVFVVSDKGNKYTFVRREFPDLKSQADFVREANRLDKLMESFSEGTDNLQHSEY